MDNGCDFFNSSEGRWLVDGDVLRYWELIDGEEVPREARVIDLDTLELPSRQGPQSWIRGGICIADCGSLGPNGLEPCDDPFF